MKNFKFSNYFVINSSNIKRTLKKLGGGGNFNSYFF
jgi:hypothetical protein